MPARDALGIVAAIDWTPVLVALINMVGAIISASVGLLVYWHIRTPSGTRLGKQVEDAQHIALANHYRLTRLVKEFGIQEEDR